MNSLFHFTEHQNEVCHLEGLNNYEEQALNNPGVEYLEG